MSIAVANYSSFADAMRAAGIPPPTDLVANGRLHRFHVEGDRSGGFNGWYVLFADGIPFGLFGSWKTGVTHRWCSKSKYTMSTAERSNHRKQVATATAARKRALELRRDEARKRAAAIWVGAETAPAEHPYLARKGVRAHSTRVHNGKLVIPLHDCSGTLQSLQFITSDGTKRFMTGGRIRGCYHGIGKPNSVLVVAEGFATGATIHGATGHAVAIAFSAGNLEPVAKALRNKFPDIQLIIAADNDCKTPGNPGVTTGRKAAEAVNATLVIPEFEHNQSGSDWNDYSRINGLDAVHEAFERPGAVLTREQLPGQFIYIGFKTVFINKGGHAILQFRHVSTGKVVDAWFNVILGDYQPGPNGKFNISKTHSLYVFMHRFTGLPKQPIRVNQRLSHLKKRTFYGVAEYRGGRWHLDKGLSEEDASHFCKNARSKHDQRTEPVGGLNVGGKTVGGTDIPKPIKQQRFPENSVRAERADESCALLPPKNPHTIEENITNTLSTEYPGSEPAGDDMEYF